MGLLPARAVFRNANEGLEVETVKVLLQNGVDDAGDGVGSVNGRSAVGQLIVLLHQDAGYDGEVGIRRRAFNAGRRHAPAVDQDQRAAGAEAAKVRRHRARAVVKHETLEREVVLNSRRGGGLLEDGAGVHQPGFALDVRDDDLQRRDAGVSVAFQARAGDDYGFHRVRIAFFFLLIRFLRCCFGGVVLSRLRLDGLVVRFGVAGCRLRKSRCREQ